MSPVLLLFFLPTLSLPREALLHFSSDLDYRSPTRNLGGAVLTSDTSWANNFRSSAFLCLQAFRTPAAS
jgi:hypothetical protein